jgi:ankyrin repeat protein
MSRLIDLRSLLLSTCLILVVATPPLSRWGLAQNPESAATAKQQLSQAEPESEFPEEVPEDELAPAAMQLDIKSDSPLIKALYEATRATKEQDILAQIAQAKALVDGSADLKATDAQGRTALHWAVFGSSYNTRQKVIVAYEEIADEMIHRGVDINREDMYQNTAFDYLLYSPNFEMQTLMLENGATSGFLAASYRFLEQIEQDPPKTATAAVSLSRKADLTPGLTLSVRLDVPVYSDRSRTGDPIEATVTYPLCKTGENIACNPGELLIPPGTRLNGTVLFAQKAPDKYSRPRLVLDFSNVLYKNGQRTPLYTRVLDVDNARETVRNNEILGIVQPHASKKVSIAVVAVSAANPIAGYTLKGIQTIYGLSIRREILYPSGTDVQIQVVRPSMLKQKEAWDGWPAMPITPDLQKLAQSAPMRTAGTNGAPSDPTNLMFLGTQDQLVAAFGEAGWIEADDMGPKSAVKAAQATLRQTGYGAAPFSNLKLEGRSADVMFQKSLNTFAKRHHIRIWKLPDTYNGQQVWVGAATHDIATTSARGYTKWSHRIDPHIDRERDWVATDLLFVGTAKAYADVPRPNAPKKLANATGDNIVTDGKITVLKLAETKKQPALDAREAEVRK